MKQITRFQFCCNILNDTTSNDSEVCRAIIGLKNYGDCSIAEEIIPYLTHTSPEIVAVATNALKVLVTERSLRLIARIGDHTALFILTGVILERERVFWPLREYACHLLAEIDAEYAAEFFHATILLEPNDEVRHAMISRLGEIGKHCHLIHLRMLAQREEKNATHDHLYVVEAIKAIIWREEKCGPREIPSP